MVDHLVTVDHTDIYVALNAISARFMNGNEVEWCWCVDDATDVDVDDVVDDDDDDASTHSEVAHRIPSHMGQV